MRPRRAFKALLAATAIVVFGSCQDVSGPGPSTSVVVTPSEATVRAGETVQLTATLEDENGNPHPTLDVTWISSDQGIAGVSTSGVVTGGAVGGPVTITASVGSSSGRTFITVINGLPSQLVVETQPAAVVTSGSALSPQPVVQLEDSQGNEAPEPGIAVTAVLDEGSGALSNATATTDEEGRATFSGLGITGEIGTYRLRFESTGLTTATSEEIRLTAVDSLSFAVEPSSTAQSGSVFTTQPEIVVHEADGGPIPGQSVTASILSGAGSLIGSVTVTSDQDGVAAFTDLGITDAIGDHRLAFTVGSVSIESDTITIVAGPPTVLRIQTQPSSFAPNAVAFVQQPVIVVEDAIGNPVGGLGVTAAVASGAGTLGGITTVTTDGSGVATFTDLQITGTVGDRTLRFSIDGTSVTSSSIQIVAGEPTSVAVLTQPPEFTLSGVTLGQSPVVEVRDVSDNPVPGQDVDVAIATGGGSLGGTTTATTTGSGAATFADLSLIGNVGARTLLFSWNGVQTTSDPVNVSYGEGFYADVPYCGAQRLDVYAPDNSFPRPVPVAVYVHGGAWTGRDKQTGVFLDPITDTLVARGYLVVSINYRLATASASTKWPAQIHDVKCAVRHLRAEAGNYGFDGVRIGAWGDSAGGHLAAMLGLADANDGGLEGSQGYPEESSRIAAAATIAAITDMSEPQQPDHDELGFTPSSVFTSWPGNPPNSSTELDEASPIWWTTSDDPPFLIIHGDEDTTVNYAQAVRLKDRLNGVGGAVTLLTVLNGGHELQDVGMGTPSLTIDEVAQEIADFLDIYVRFNP